MKVYRLAFLISLTALSLGSEALAKKYALVIGGSSMQTEPSTHEFARQIIAVSKGLQNKEYDVTTLFGGPQIPSSNASDEQDKYSQDYKYFQDIKDKSAKNSRSSYDNATSSNISHYFDELAQKVKPGDQVEIYVTAHGIDTCGESGRLETSDIGSSCTHTFTVFDQNGRAIQYDSRKLLLEIIRNKPLKLS